MVRGVIFDMDGLMFDTERLSTLLWGQTGKEIGIEIPESFVDSFRGRNPEAIRRAFLDRYGAGFDYEGSRERKDGLVDEHIEKNGVPVKKGLPELLDYLKEHQIHMAVATSTQQELAEKMLKLAGIYPYFSAVVYGDMVEKSKPAPDIFQKAAEQIGVESKDCLVLEDSSAGVMAGKAAGGYVIHIPDVLQVPEEVKDGITAEYESLDQVIGWLEKQNQ